MEESLRRACRPHHRRAGDDEGDRCCAFCPSLPMARDPKENTSPRTPCSRHRRREASRRTTAARALASSGEGRRREDEYRAPFPRRRRPGARKIGTWVVYCAPATGWRGAPKDRNLCQGLRPRHRWKGMPTRRRTSHARPRPRWRGARRRRAPAVHMKRIWVRMVAHTSRTVL